MKEVERVTGDLSSRLQLQSSLLFGVWLLFVFLYTWSLATGSPSMPFLEVAVLSGAVLCVSFDKSCAVPLAIAAVPLFVIAVWLRISTMSAALVALGSSGVVVLAYHAERGNQFARQNLRIAAAFPLFVILAGSVNYGIIFLTPNLYDGTLAGQDFGISAEIRRWALARPWRVMTLDYAYASLPLAASIVIGYTTSRARSHLLRAMCLASLLAVPCYFLVPAVGPKQVGQPIAPRNCMPSLHATWAALLWLNARPVSLRWLAPLDLCVSRHWRPLGLVSTICLTL